MFHRTGLAALIMVALAVVVVYPTQAQEPADTTEAAEPAGTAEASPGEESERGEVKPAVFLYEKAKLVVGGEAEADGLMEFAFAPAGGKEVVFSISVLEKTKKNDIAKAIYTELSLAAGDDYKVKNSGEEVKIEKANKENAAFSLFMEKVALPGISVLIKKD